MRRLGAICSGLILAFGFAAACSSDEKAKHLAEVGGAGGALGGAGAAPVSQGGGSNRPTAGQGGGEPTAGQGGAAAGESTGVGGLASAGQSGAGSGGESPLPQAGAAGAAGAGGDSGLSCPAEIGSFSYQCAEVAEFWAPVWNPSASRFEFDPSNLPFPIKSGTLTYFYTGVDGQFCGDAQVVMQGSLVTIPIAPQQTPVSVRVSTFKFVDVCGNAHNYDAVGAPACFDLRGIAGTGATTLDCNSTLTANCPEGCG